MNVKKHAAHQTRYGTGATPPCTWCMENCKAGALQHVSLLSCIAACLEPPLALSLATLPPRTCCTMLSVPNAT